MAGALHLWAGPVQMKPRPAVEEHTGRSVELMLGDVVNSTRKLTVIGDWIVLRIRASV